MPPRGVKRRKRTRQYEHIKESAKKKGRSSRRAKEIAAATVNKQRRQAGETRGSRKRSTASSRKRSTTSRKTSSRKKTSRKSASRKTARKSSSKKR